MNWYLLELMAQAEKFGGWIGVAANSEYWVHAEDLNKPYHEITFHPLDGQIKPRKKWYPGDMICRNELIETTVSKS